MIDDRSMHTATLLSDGTVLVTGGIAGPQTDSAELYDPATGSWTAAGTTASRSGHTATLLLDGRVLVAGGFDFDDGRLASADLYDPTTRSWTAAANMIEARFEHTATLLPDGRVLVAGGTDTTSAELYDPRTGTWTAAGGMVTGHRAHTATLLPDGTVLVAGDAVDFSSSAELYDPRTGTWTATGSMSQGSWDDTATLLPDGTVLVAGTEGANSAELYDPRTRTWTATGSMSQARSQHAATLLPDGTVLVTGGNDGIVDGDDPAVASAELYDPVSGRWTTTANMNTARRLHTATRLPDGAVLVAGGVGGNGAPASTELYAPGIGTIPSPQPPNSAQPSVPPVAGRIVYTRHRTIKNGDEDCRTSGPPCHRSSVFMSDQDGSGEREIVPGPRSSVIAASPDGSKLIVIGRESDPDHAYVTGLDGSEPQPLDTGCQLPCVEDWLGSSWEPGLAFSPDGSRLAFVRGFSDDVFGDARSVIAIMDMATGAMVELGSTAGAAGPPSWSPDGAHLIFGSFVVDADGSNLHRVIPTELSDGGPAARGARWSPDGSLIVFASSIDTLAKPGVIDNSQRLSDLYTVRPDGSGLQRLTTDTVGPLGTEDPGDFGARYPSWTRDGRIVFSRDAGPGEAVMQLWVMDRDGNNATRLDPSDAAALAAIGCVSCPYPAIKAGDLLSVAFWVPAR